MERLPVIVNKSEMVNTIVEWKCPHCESRIGENDLYVTGPNGEIFEAGVEPFYHHRGCGKSILLPSQIIAEAQPQGTKERVDRKVRIPKVTPPTPNFDLTPKKKADNDPTKTSRGRAALRRQIKRNKMHPERFVEDHLNVLDVDPIVAFKEGKRVIDSHMDGSGKEVIFKLEPRKNLGGRHIYYAAAWLRDLDSDSNKFIASGYLSQVVYNVMESIGVPVDKIDELFNSIGAVHESSDQLVSDVISEVKSPVKLMKKAEESNNKRMSSIINNVWEDRIIEEHVAVAKPGHHSDKVALNNALNLCEDMKGVGDNRLIWVERIAKNDGLIIYKCYSDVKPSKLYESHRLLEDRTIIFPQDHAKII